MLQRSVPSAATTSWHTRTRRRSCSTAATMTTSACTPRSSTRTVSAVSGVHINNEPEDLLQTRVILSKTILHRRVPRESVLRQLQLCGVVAGGPEVQGRHRGRPPVRLLPVRVHNTNMQTLRLFTTKRFLGATMTRRWQDFSQRAENV